MFEPIKPNKITKEQLDALLQQTKMFKDYFSNLEDIAQLSKDNIAIWPFMGFGGVEKHVDSALEQASIYKNYFAMTEVYLGMVAGNVDMWHTMYIDKKNNKKS